MLKCNACSKWFDPELTLGNQEFCPHCGEELVAASEPEWSSLAKVTSLAEAGFFSDELGDQGIAARIVELESFSALTGGWSCAYVLQVQSAKAEEAAEALQNMLDQDPLEEDSAVAARLFGVEEGTADPVIWRPVAMMVLAGMASFWVGHYLATPRVQRAEGPLPDALRVAMEEIGRPFVTEPLPGQAQYRLSFNSNRQSWDLDKDADADGRYELRHRFRVEAASQ